MILERLTVGPLAANCYLLGCERTRQAAVIDPGDEPKRIRRTVEKSGLSLQTILLTHAHIDHLGAAHQLQIDTRAELFMHRAELPLLQALPVQAATFGLSNPGIPKPDRFVEDGEEILLGEILLKVLHTPGHSPGGLSFLFEKMVFVGDLLFAGSIGRTDLPGGSYETLLQSVQKKLLTLDDEVTVYPGLGPMTTIGEERKHNPFLQGV